MKIDLQKDDIKVTKTSRGTSILSVNGVEVKKNDILEFICQSCGRETKQQFRYKKFFLELDFRCSKCRVESTCLDKYGVKNGGGSKQAQEKIKKTKLKRYRNENFNNSNQIKKTQIEKYGSLGFNTEKQRETLKEKYGAEVMFKTDHFKNESKKTKLNKYEDENFNNREKSKQTNLEKYKVENYFQSNDFKEKSKKTNIERYDVEFPTQNKEIYNKIEKTVYDKYGVKKYIHSKDFREKTRKTNLEKYGTEHHFKNKEIREKMYNNDLKKHGVKFTSQSKEIQERIKQTNLEKYGEKYFLCLEKTELMKENSKKTKFKKMYQKCLENDLITPLFNLDEYNGIQKNYSWKCNVCGEEFEDDLIKGHIPRCPNCFPRIYSTSNKEKEIVEFIKSLNIENIIENDRKLIQPLELDIYLPDYKVAIEFDGLYWHSDRFIDKNYHLEKTEMCENIGIRLIHIFEDEWDTRKEIVKARLKNLLGKNSKRIGARQTIIKEIDSKTKNKFVDKYHIQGKDMCSIKLGAFFQDELIGVMTFSKPRVFMGKKVIEGKWELSRFVTKSDMYTPGLASKLLKHFQNNYVWNEIYSYADRRWSRGHLYEAIGFEKNESTQPNYFYWKPGDRRYHRFNFRKDRLKSFENYSPEKTEKQIMDEAGWFRIYDSGNHKYTIKRA